MLGINKIYGNHPFHEFVWGDNNNHNYIIYGLLNNTLVGITASLGASGRDTAVFSKLCYIDIKDICTIDNNTEFLFRILDECKFGTITSIKIKNNNDIVIKFYNPDTSKINELCRKYDNINREGLLNNNIRINLKQYINNKNKYDYLFEFKLL